MTSKNKVIVHVFYEGDKGTTKKSYPILLMNTPYADIPVAIDRIVAQYYSTCSWHEIHSITTIKDQIYVNGELI